MSASVSNVGATGAVTTTVDTVAKAAADAQAAADANKIVKDAAVNAAVELDRVLSISVSDPSRNAQVAPALSNFYAKNYAAGQSAKYDALTGLIDTKLISITNPTRNTLVGRAQSAYNAMPAFATGGDFSGGLRIVGENGPELEATGASRIFNANQTKNILSGGNDNSEIVAELRAVRSQLANVQSELSDIKRTNAEMNRTMDKFDIDGLPETRLA